MKGADKKEVPFIKPWTVPSDRVLTRIQKALETGQLTNNGPMVRQFEAELADFLQTHRVVAVSNGSAALLLVLQAIKAKGKAILPSFTYVATLNAVENAGLHPVFCDIDPDTWTMDPTHLHSLLKENPDCRVILPVNVYGVHPDLVSIVALAKQYGARVVYDNAHGFGSVYGRPPVPPGVLAATFSFHATKVLPAVEGGAVISNDPNLLDLVACMRNHGLTPDPLDSITGYNAKLSELNAVVGLESLSKINKILTNRRNYATRIRNHISDCCSHVFKIQHVPVGQATNFQNLVVTVSVPDSAALVPVFKDAGVQVRPYFRPALHRLHRNAPQPGLPVTEYVADRVLALPIHSFMGEDQLQTIEQALTTVAAKVEKWT